MFSKISRTAALTLAFVPGLALAESALIVNITGAEPPTGTVEISLFRSADDFLKTMTNQTRCTPDESGRCSVTFHILEEGDFALVAVHDANDNNKLDNGFLGFGGERFGYSNDARNPLFGRASFDDAKITVSEPMEITIKLD